MKPVKRSWIVIFIALIAAAFFGQRQFGTHQTPQGQPALAQIDSSSLEALRADFNAASDSVRLIVLLSPT